MLNPRKSAQAPRRQAGQAPSRQAGQALVELLPSIVIFMLTQNMARFLSTRKRIFTAEERGGLFSIFCLIFCPLFNR